MEKVFTREPRLLAMEDFLDREIGQVRLSGAYWDSAVQGGRDINSLKALT